MNVPDDWNCYWLSCPRCGTNYHASEGGCDCEDRQADKILHAIGAEAEDLPGSIEVVGTMVELDHATSEALGYLRDGSPTQNELRRRHHTLDAIARAARACQIELEVCAYDRDAGESWTVAMVGG